jgi:hypothetical protein
MDKLYRFFNSKFTPEISQVIVRFIRVFITSGMASVALIQPDFHDIRKLVTIVAIAFIAGGLSGMAKYLREQYDLALPI